MTLLAPSPLPAAGPDPWWDDAWPYRIPVTAGGSGVVEVSIDFTTALDALGLNGGLLDLRSVRVVPYYGTEPGSPVPYAESYSDLLNAGESTAGWSINDGGGVEVDAARYTQGAGSLKATVINTEGGYGYPGVEFHPSAITDWRGYETFLYDVWPEVNQNALDQAPDLYWFKLYNTGGCPTSSITQGGPALALDQWNGASVSLNPLHTCTTPNLSSITRMEFHTRDNVDGDVSGPNGLWDDGDVLTLWFDNLRLVDQDSGTLRWYSDGTAAKFYIYFDVLEHEGHPWPELADPGPAALSGAAAGPEAGGYFHRIDNANTGSLAVWSAPPLEKILKTNVPPTAGAPLRISAARDEYEPFQLVVRSSGQQTLAVSIGDLVSGEDIIPAGNVTLHRVDYVPITRLSDDFGRIGDWPDPLYPLEMGSPVTFPAGQNQPLWFTVHVPRNAEPGLYQATVTIGPATIPVELEVWNLTLPQEIHLEGEWGFGWSQVVERYKGTISGSVQPCYWTLVDALYEHFAGHRLTPKGVGWPAGLNFDYDCDTGILDPGHNGNIWYFESTAQKYLRGSELDNGTGFPSFLIRGPSSNWPPASRPSSFCGASRGTDPPGNSAYNEHWFQYWSEVSRYLGQNPDYAAKGYYHIVNEPQTLSDYDIVAYLAQQTRLHAPNVRIMVSEQVEPGIYANAAYPGAKIDVWMPTISSYQVERAHDRQANHGEDVWWYFLYGDRPPLPNPTVIDRPGIEARITPWLAWLERVDGLLYYSTTDWSSDIWTDAWNEDGNGDGFMFYPPKDSSIAYNACQAQSNRLVPSIRWELLREGMEDYEYLWLLNQGDPQIGVPNQADELAGRFIDSRTLFSRVPTDLYETRAAIAAQFGAEKTASSTNIGLNELLDYTLAYHWGSAAHTVTITDSVPAATTVLTVTASSDPPPVVDGQTVVWTTTAGAGQGITLTITTQAVEPGLVENTAIFSGTQVLTKSVRVLVNNSRVFLPLLLKR